jgi:hypothetical protein
MKKIAIDLLLASLLLLPASSPAHAAPAEPSLASANWSTNSSSSLATNPPSDRTVLEFVYRLERESWSGLCFSRFVDLRHSGNLSFVLSVSDGRFCYGTTVIDKTASGFEVYNFEGAHFSNGPEIKDLLANGNLELIVDTEFTPYRGTNTRPCLATWPVIYAWTGTTYADVSSQFKEYYEKKLVSLKARIAANSAVTEPDCTEAEAAKIERFLGISKDAGTADVIKWADSNDPNERVFAAAVLKDIATPDAIEYLRTLSHDLNGLVAEHAQIDLQEVGRGPVLHTVERVEKSQEEIDAEQVVDDYGRELMKVPGVWLVGAGRDSPSQQFHIRVGVEKITPEVQAKIPKTLGGFPVVIMVAPSATMSLATPGAYPETNKSP